MKAFGQNNERIYQNPPRHPLILGAHLHAEHPYLKPPTKKRGEGGRVKGNAKNLEEQKNLKAIKKQTKKKG
jgi:hypothetical protein